MLIVQPRLGCGFHNLCDDSRLHLLDVEIQSADLCGLRQFLEDYADAAPIGVMLYRGEHAARVHEQIVAMPVGLVV